MKNLRDSQSGLTLVELIIAVALMGFILLGIAPLFLASVKSNYSADQYTSIHNLARDRLEQLMNLPVCSPAFVNQLAIGTYPNDLPLYLPNPKTGVPPSSGGVPNLFRRTYSVQHFLIPASATIGNGAPFTPTLVGPGVTYSYKRIDVTVESVGGPIGIGVRVARVTGFLQNPSPATCTI